MRRLAAQSRNDSYASTRDYQELHQKVSQRFTTQSIRNCISFAITEELADQSSFVGVGAYIFGNKSIPLTVRLIVNEVQHEHVFNIGHAWSRIGFAVDASIDAGTLIYVELEWEGPLEIDIWGLDAGKLLLPQKILQQGPTARILNSSHISPETFYLDHSTAVGLDFIPERSTHFTLVQGSDILVKKCSFCQRYLPVNPHLRGSLSFHKHRAKKTFHQNECRSCKKWRINDEFNPIRTTDQLHESSVITRERKVLLREPLILQGIKERTGAGLKSQVWERFGRKCFYCGVPVALDDFQLDHTRPLSYLWPIDEHATCLCAEHNNLKKDRFPVEFYNEAQLQKLSEITGLGYSELTAKKVNEVELQRIRNDIVGFATAWDARTFAAIARKITELMPDVDLFELLKDADIEVHERVLTDLQQRPLL